MMQSIVSDHGLQLLTVNSPKTVKGENAQWVTGILYLAPARTSGVNMCPQSTPGCEASCLFTAGRGAMSRVQNARIRKTLWFSMDRRGFMEALCEDIAKLEARALAKGFRLCIRLNGTSDVLWHKIRVRNKPNIHSVFPHIQFYDYTKQRPAKFSGKPGNLHVTYSRSELNEEEARKLSLAGLPVAVVWRDELPATYWGKPVYDADQNDLRFLDPPGHIVGLLAKGRAKKDETGFVI